MGLLNFFASRKAVSASEAVIEIAQNGQFRGYQSLGGTNRQVVNAWEQAQSSSYAWLYRTQPAVRTTVDYIATNVSQLPLKLYERVDDNERQTASDHPAAVSLRRPYQQMNTKRWIFNFVADWLIYDNAYAVKFPGPNGTRTLVRVPPHMMGICSRSRFSLEGYRVHRDDGSTYPENGMLDPSDVIHWVGFDPDDPRTGLSKLETLRQILAEEAAAVTASTELLKSGLQKNGWIYRPLDAPDWGTAGREHFEQDLYNKVTSKNKKWPVLEEGMEIRDLGVTPKDAEMLEGRRFTQETVAAEYGLKNIPPETEDERKQFLSDVLAPLTEDLAEVLDSQVLQAEYGADDYYFEFDLNEKLRGDIENRFQAITAAVGGPWQSRNEARARENLPPIEGGDELITPLNVTSGRNPRPAPNVMPPQDANRPSQDGSHRESSAAPETKALYVKRREDQLKRRDSYASDLTSLRDSLLGRQERALRASKAATPPQRWAKWDKEFADDLEAQIARIVEREGDITAQRLGNLAFDSRVTKNYVRAMAEDIAKKTNAATKAAVGESDDIGAAFDGRRAETGSWAVSTASGASSFAQMEAAKQDSGPRFKTWVVTASNSAHPEMDGETVPLGETFSNGSDGPPAEHAGCACLLDIS